MKLNEIIITKLQEKFPGKTVHLNTEADPITFKTYTRLSVNGKRTNFGFYPETWAEQRAVQGTDLLVLVDQFVDTVRGIEIL